MDATMWWIISAVILISIVSGQDRPACDSKVYCRGHILDTVQRSGVFNSSKYYVDMQMRYGPAIIEEKFNAMLKQTRKSPKKTEVLNFVTSNFREPGSEFQPWGPSEWKPNPPFLRNIFDADLRKWAAKIHATWKTLGRKIANDVLGFPDKQSIVYAPHPFVVPGGEAREFYYWDSYWIMHGLLVSNMTETAKNMILNLCTMARIYNFVPNGNRIYYIRRSQPPYLIPMMKLYLDYTNDDNFLDEYIEALDKEFTFWMNNRIETIMGPDGKAYNLARYNVEITGPRPEGYIEDLEIAKTLASTTARRNFYMDIKSACESGWDFSSRWIINDQKGNSGNLTDISTRDIIPVDLNSLLCYNALTLAEFYQRRNLRSKQRAYLETAQKLNDSINALLYDEREGAWFDYDKKNKKLRKYFYASNLHPLWSGCYGKPGLNRDTVVSKAISYLKNSGAMNYPGGIPASLENTGEQWDYPYAWAPLQHLLAMGFDRTGNAEAKELARSIAQKWIYNNHQSFQKTNAMHQRYDVRDYGQLGVVKGKQPQVGYGWTNGVALDFLHKWGNVLDATTAAASTVSSLTSMVVSIVAAVVLRFL